MTNNFSAVLAGGNIPETRKAGDVIFAMGESAHCMYVIKSGQVQIRIGNASFDTVEAGGIFGEMSLLDDDVRSASAVAITDCEVVPIDKACFLERVREQPLIAVQIAKLMVRRLRAMNFMAYHDPLTRLPNRALFQERCERAIMHAKHQGTMLGVLFVDIDHFKAVNESFGYASGDLLLNQLAARLSGALHELDTFARLGADEFAALVESVRTVHDLATTAQSLLDVLSDPFPVAGQNIYVTTSVGVSCYPQDGANAHTLLSSADTAMRVAKTQGRNCSCFSSPEHNAVAIETLTLKNHLRQTLAGEGFHLNYQPRVDLASGRVDGTEALIRWRHPQRGLISPATFIPIAEQTGLIEHIGEWVLRTACAQQRAWLSSGLPPFRIAVNLSVRQLRQADLTQRIAAILDETGLDASGLELEVTESVFTEDAVHVKSVLKELRSLGIAIALDDFGTGYSSLGYLKQFPLDYLKIDQSFVRGLPNSLEDAAIVRTVITLAKTLGLKVIAEGVESEEQLAFLKEHDCEQYQGYLFSRPVPAEDMEALLRENLGE